MQTAVFSLRAPTSYSPWPLRRPIPVRSGPRLETVLGRWRWSQGPAAATGWTEINSSPLSIIKSDHDWCCHYSCQSPASLPPPPIRPRLHGELSQQRMTEYGLTGSIVLRLVGRTEQTKEERRNIDGGLNSVGYAVCGLPRDWMRLVH